MKSKDVMTETAEREVQPLKPVDRATAENGECAANNFCKPGLLVAGGMGVGAALMYLFDPARGKARRRKLVDQARSARRHCVRIAEGIEADIVNRASGAAAETRALFRSEPVSDEIIEGRVRSKLGRVVSHPHAIQVTVRRGRVTLRGPVLAREVDHLLCAVGGIRSVVEVENRLEMYESSAGVPQLEGGAPLRRGTNWKPFLRLAGLIGFGLLARSGTERNRHAGSHKAATGLPPKSQAA